MTPTEFTVASCVYHRDKAKSAAHRSLTKTQQDRAHSSGTPLSLAPLKVFWKHRLPLVCQSLSACTGGHFHLGGTDSSKREATLGLSPDTEMPRVQDKHKFQVAAQHPSTLAWVDGRLPRVPQTESGQAGREAWVPAVRDFPYLLGTH